MSIETEIKATAARWTVRRDRGLSSREAIEFELWLAADTRHAAAIERAGVAWAKLDRIPDSVGEPLVRQIRARSRWFAWAGIAAALAVGFTLFQLGSKPQPPLQVNASQSLILSDGTIVRLNENSTVTEEFTLTERRVRLVRGEAHFTVTKNPARPFLVRAGTIEVRAVGTAFNVNLHAASVEVLVTEGRVAVKQHVGPSLVDVPGTEHGLPSSGSPTFLAAGERTIVSLTSPMASRVEIVPSAEIARTLAWQEPLLRLNGVTLMELAAEFERRSGTRLIIADPRLAELRLGGRFRADDVEGFVRVLGENYQIRATHAPDGTIHLERVP